MRKAKVVNVTDPSFPPCPFKVGDEVDIVFEDVDADSEFTRYIFLCWKEGIGGGWMAGDELEMIEGG